MPRKSKEDQAHIIRLWHDNPFVWPKAIAAKAALENAYCCAATAQKFYPFERWTNLIRVDQAIRALQIYPDCTTISIEHKTGISRSTIGKAKRVVVDGGDSTEHKTDTSRSTTGKAKQVIAKSVPTPVANQMSLPFESDDVYLRAFGQIDDASYILRQGQRDNFSSIALAQPVLDTCEDDKVRMALVLMWVRMCHLVRDPNHSDSVDDIQGYAKVIRMIQYERRQRE